MSGPKEEQTEKIDIVQILEKLPHRYPFILVDRVLEVDVVQNRILAIKNVTINEPFFQGHFPNLPIMPGVLIVEALAQTGGILMYQKGYRGIKVLASLREVKFRKIVVPGDTIRLECVAVHLSSRGGKIKGCAMVDGKVATEGEIVFGVLPA
ncbi:MAG: 3-hydroxyacyl-[acyl-carrier-protein] dehydratase FabZ [Chlamydiae bacterium RIFCSPHIGHO2_12_FULL_49_11]|nr:MAG: 3-hydroxyacyl-[acyl-carrier-protein] dehydratase FabZ [Chlamydiae bacterium RIFCSPHIGHO2_12_FULL_49_11]